MDTLLHGGEKQVDVKEEMMVENEDSSFGDTKFTISQSERMNNLHDIIDVQTTGLQIKIEPEDLYPGANSNLENTDLNIENDDWENGVKGLENPIDNSSVKDDSLNLQAKNYKYADDTVVKVENNDHCIENYVSCREADDITLMNENEVNEQFGLGFSNSRPDVKSEHLSNLTLNLQPETIFHQGLPVCQITQNNFCHTCNKWFSSIDHLNEHMFSERVTPDEKSRISNTSERVAPDEKSTSLDTCKIPLKNSSAADVNTCNCSGKESTQKVESPTVTPHQTDRPHKCDVCKATVKSITHLNIHNVVHFGGKLFHCDECDSRFKNSTDLTNHTIEHSTVAAENMSPDKTRHKCSLCEKCFPKQSSLKRHMVCHTDKFKCTLCDQGFRGGIYLKAHMMTHSGERPCKCGVCGKGFKLQSNLNTHMVSHLDTRPIKCKLCDKSFKLPTHLKTHMLTHVDDFPLKCKLCDKGFKYLSSLNTHMVTHSDTRPITCKLCIKTFKLPSHLKMHMLTHADDLPLKCDVCAKGFQFESALKAHMWIHSDDRPFKCSVCEKGFDDRDLFNGHMIKHSDVCSFKCPVCGIGFKTNDGVKRHMPTHSDERPYKCTMCVNAYKTKKSLRNHMSRDIHI